MSKSTVGTSDSQTQIGWEVDDLQVEIDELRARGVRIEDYDLPDLKTQDGIADVGFAWMSWIIDPGKNASRSSSGSPIAAARSEHRRGWTTLLPHYQAVVAAADQGGGKRMTAKGSGTRRGSVAAQDAARHVRLPDVA